MTSEQIKEILKTKKVGIAGCGGLGSNCAAALVRAGVVNLVIVDFDVVEESNLNRQFYFFDQVGLKKSPTLKENLLRINRGLDITVHDLRVTTGNVESLFGSCDVLVEAFDLADQKAMLIETVLDRMPEMPLVVGLGLAGWGRNEMIHYRRMGNIYICGDEISEVTEELPPLAPRVGIVACMQANTVVEILLK